MWGDSWLTAEGRGLQTLHPTRARPEREIPINPVPRRPRWFTRQGAAPAKNKEAVTTQEEVNEPRWCNVCRFSFEQREKLQEDEWNWNVDLQPRLKALNKRRQSHLGFSFTSPETKNIFSPLFAAGKKRYFTLKLCWAANKRQKLDSSQGAESAARWMCYRWAASDFGALCDVAKGNIPRVFSSPALY